MDLWQDLFGLDLPPERQAELLAEFAPILAEIAKLRTLDLTEIHPAVIFVPAVDQA